MVRSLVGAAAAAVLGALVGAGGLALAYMRAPAVALPFDRPLPQVLAGFYNLERSGDLTFAWTGPQATVRLPGLDRWGVDWRCSIRLRGGRAPGVPQPTVSIDVEGVTAARVTATNVFEDISIDVPATSDDIRSSMASSAPQVLSGLTLTIASAPTFVPGPGDRRELGVQVDHIACAPTGGVAMPPRRGLAVAAIAAACFAVAFVALGAPLWLSLLAATALAGAQALAMVTGPALYTRYLDRVPWLALVPAVSAVMLAGGHRVANGPRRQPGGAFRPGVLERGVVPVAAGGAAPVKGAGRCPVPCPPP